MIGILILSLFTSIFFFWLYACIFFRINEFEAQNIAIQVIRDKYSKLCWGGFEKYLWMEPHGYDARYEFYSDNWRCNIYINISSYWAYDTGIMPDN